MRCVLPLVALLLVISTPAKADVITLVDGWDHETYTLDTNTFQRVDDWYLAFDETHQFSVIGITLGQYADAGQFFRLDTFHVDEFNTLAGPTEYFRNWQAMMPVLNAYMGTPTVGVPEPSTLLLSMVGLSAVWLRRRRETQRR